MSNPQDPDEERMISELSAAIKTRGVTIDSRLSRAVRDKTDDEQAFMDLLKEFKIQVDGFPHNTWVKLSNIYIGIGDTSYGSFTKASAISFVHGYVAGRMHKGD